MQSHTTKDFATGVEEVGSGTPTKENVELERINTYERTGDLAKYQTHQGDDLSQEHRDYLMQRHGTLDLVPIPGYGDADPYNWSTWKVWPLRAFSCPTKIGLSHYLLENR